MAQNQRISPTANYKKGTMHHAAQKMGKGIEGFTGTVNKAAPVVRGIVKVAGGSKRR